VSQHKKKGLDQFLRLQLFRERSIPLEKFVLRHSASGSRGTEIDEFPITGQVSQDHIAIMADDIMVRAQSYADGLGSKSQKFALEAVVEGAKTGPRFMFSLRGESDEDDEDGEEQPTERGLTQQLMRHNEALMRMLVMTTGTSVTHLQKQLEKAGETITDLVQQQNEHRKMIEAANTEQHERDMQMLLTSGQEDRKSALFKQVEQLIPIVMRKAMGAPLLTDKEQSVIGPFLSSLTKEQVQGIAQNLSPEQQIALFKIYQEVTASEKQKSDNGVS